jgi:hypothetical protein
MTVRPKATSTQAREQAAQAPPAVLPAAVPEALKTMLQTLVQETLAAEFTRFLGAAPHARSPERRGWGNGSRSRTLLTRVGSLELRVPRDRAGQFQPALFARYHRSVTLDSPPGDPVRVDTTQRLTLVVSLDEMDVSEASIRVDGRSINPSPVDLNFEDIDQAPIDRVEAGALRLEIGNPFHVSGSIRATLQTPTTAVDRTLTVNPGATTQRLELTDAELGTILGQPSATLVVSGVLSAPSDVAVIRPRQAITIHGRVEVDLSSAEQ